MSKHAFRKREHLEASKEASNIQPRRREEAIDRKEEEQR